MGTGFDAKELKEIRDRTTRRSTPAALDAPSGPRHVWVEPELVCEVRFKEWTHGRSLRLPVFARLRDDKRPEECQRSGAEEPEAVAPAAPEPTVAPPPPPPAVKGRRRSPSGSPELSNLDKVFWPEEGYTKGDLLA